MNSQTASIESSVLCDIIELATRAPSAENTQPWKLSWDGETLTVFHDRSRQMASDLDGMLDLTGIGALIESLAIAASGHGFKAEVQLKDSGSDEGASERQPVATLKFSEGAEPDPHFNALASRCTTRRMEKGRLLSPEQLDSLKKVTSSFSGVRVDWVPQKDIPLIAKLVGQGNRIRFERREFQQEIYDNLRFTASEVERTRDGLDVRTLQLPWGVSSLMRWLAPWPRTRLANLLGYSRCVSKQASDEVQSSGAVGLLSVDHATQSSFVDGGRSLQRLWLEATRQRLAFHPTASLPVFVGYADRDAASPLSSNHQSECRRMADTLYDVQRSLNARRLQMAFRIGYGASPEVRTLRHNSSKVLQACSQGDSLLTIPQERSSLG